MKSVSALQTRIIERARGLGFEYEKTITGCCQCTIAAVQDALDIRNDAVFKAGSGLTAGGGISCEGSCGGYTGGVMVMSSVFGRCRQKWDNDRKEKDCAHRMAGALLKRFNRQYGSHICCKIHQCIFGREFDLKNAAQRLAFERSGAHVDRCTSVVGDAAAWAAALILEELGARRMTMDDLRRMV
jgi:hypothetical protein